MRTWREKLSWWWDDNAIIVLAASILPLSVAIVLITYVLTSPPACRAAVAGSPIESRWTFWAGCQVRDAAGVWIALDQYRAVAIQETR